MTIEPTRTSGETVSDTVRAWPGWCVLFVATLLLYAATANRGAQWQDSGEHIWRIVSGQVLNTRGLALSHPLHYYLGRLAIAPGLLAPAFAITLISAVAGALAVANTYGCTLTLTRRPAAAAFAACSLAVAHTVWQLATITETYTLGIALLSGELWAMLLLARTGQARFMVLMLLCNGLGIANHMQAALTTPVVIAVAWHAWSHKKIAPKHVCLGVMLWLIGTLPYSVLVVQQMVQSGDVIATLSSALFGRTYGPAVLNAAPTSRNLAVTLGFVALNFPSLLVPLAVVGLRGVWRDRHSTFTNRALLAALLIHALFAVRYKVVDQHTFFLPTYTLLCILGGAGMASVLHTAKHTTRRWVVAATVSLLFTTPLVYLAAPAVAKQLDLLKNIERHKPYRDDYVYLFTPWSIVETSAEQMSREAVDFAGEHGVIIVEDSMALPAVRYQQRRCHRDGIEIIVTTNATRITDLGNPDRPIVLVPFDRDLPSIPSVERTWQRAGDLYTSDGTRTPK